MNDMKEEWKEINEYPNYQVSNIGRIKNIKTNKILKPCVNTHGYYFVNLCKDGKAKPFSVHRLVAGAFIDNPNNLPVINHKDKNKLNNNVDNLEWCTQQYNVRYSQSRAVFGYDGQNIIELDTMRDAVKFGFSVGGIWQAIKKGICHKGYMWQYKMKDGEINPLLETLKFRYQTINN